MSSRRFQGNLLPIRILRSQELQDAPNQAGSQSSLLMSLPSFDDESDRTLSDRTLTYRSLQEGTQPTEGNTAHSPLPTRRAQSTEPNTSHAQANVYNGLLVSMSIVICVLCVLLWLSSQGWLKLSAEMLRVVAIALVVLSFIGLLVSVWTIWNLSNLRFKGIGFLKWTKWSIVWGVVMFLLMGTLLGLGLAISLDVSLVRADNSRLLPWVFLCLGVFVFVLVFMRR